MLTTFTSLHQVEDLDCFFLISSGIIVHMKTYVGMTNWMQLLNQLIKKTYSQLAVIMETCF